MAREFHGKIPKVPVDADTSKADAKIDRLFERIKDIQRVKIDADVSQAQRRLETLAKRSNDKLSSALVGTMIGDFKTVLGAMKTEYENFGDSSNIYKNLEKTCDMVEDRFSNLTISVDKKKISGLEQILNSVEDLQHIDGFSFDERSLQQVVKGTEVALSKVKEAKKEIASIAGKIDYITKTLNKKSDKTFSTEKLLQYKDKVQGLRDELQQFYSIDDELIQNSLVNAAAKINEALGEIDIRVPKAKGSVDVLSTGETLQELGAVEKKLQAIQEVSNRISKNSSINGLKNIEQEAVNVTKVLAEMYDEGIRDTERYITLQYKLSKIFDKMGKSYGGIKGSGSKDKSELIDLVVDGIYQRTGVNLFGSGDMGRVMENLFGSSDFSLFNKSLSKLNMKDIAELLLITGKTGDWVDNLPDSRVYIDKRRAELVAELDRYDFNEHYGSDDLQYIIKDNERIIQALEKENLLTDEIRQKHEAINKDITERLALMQSYESVEKNLIKMDELYDSSDLNSIESVVSLLEQRRQLIGEIPEIALDGTYGLDEQVEREKAVNKTLEQRVELLKLVKQGVIEIDDVDDIIKERGSLDDKLERLTDFIWMNGLSEKPGRDDDISEELEYFESVYDRIILKLANNRNINILPDLKGANALAKFYDSDHGEYGETEIVDIVFERVNREQLTAAIEGQAKATEKLAEARLKLTPKKDGSGGYTAMDGKYDIGQDAEGWKVFQRDNAGLWNLIGTYKHFEDIKNDVSLLTKEEIVLTDEVVQEVKVLQEAYSSMDHTIRGHAAIVNKYLEVLSEVKSGAMGAAYAISQLNEAARNKGLIAPIDNTAQEKMAETIALVAKLNEKYGTEKFGEIFGDVGAIDTSNAAEVYDTLISKENEYFAAVQARMQAQNEFLQINAELIQQNQGTESFMKKYAELTNSILNGNVGLEEANKQLQEFVGTLSDAAEKQEKLFKTPKNNYEKLFNTLALGDNAFETKSKGDVSGYNWAERETIAEAIIQGLQQGVDKVDIILNNGKTTLTFAGGLDSAAKILDLFGFKAVESELTKFIGRAIKTGSRTMYQSSDKGNYIVDATQLFKLSRPLNEFEYGRFEEYREKDISALLRGASNATSVMPNTVREALIDIPGDKKGKQEKHYIFQTEDGQYLVLKKSAFDNIRKVSSNVKYDPNAFKNGLYSSMVYGFGENGDVVSAMISRIQGLQQVITDIFNASPSVKTDFSLPNKNVLNIAGVVSTPVDKEGLAQIPQIMNEAAKATDNENKLLEDFNKRAEEVYGELRKHMTVWDASEMVGDITSSVNENVISVEEGFKQLEDRYASWSAKHEKLSQKTSEASNNIRIFNDAIKNQLQGVAGNSDAIKEYSKMLSEISSGAISAADAVSHMQKKLSAYDAAPSDVSFVPYRIDKQQAESIIDSKVDRQAIEKWYLSKADHSARDELGQLAMSDDELRNATLNLLFDAYLANGGQLSFDNFVNSDTTIYRGTSKQNENQSTDGKFISFTLDKNVAEQFASNIVNGVSDGMVVAIGTKIKDVVGSFSDSLSKEMELFVSRDKLDNALLSGESKESAVVNESLEAKQKQSEVTNQIVEQTKNQIDAENKLADAANNVADAKERQAEASHQTVSALNDQNVADVSVEELIARDVNEALEQLRSAKNNETTLFTLKGVFEGDDLIEQAQAMVKNIAEQANLSLGKFNVKDDIIKVQLYNEALKVTVDQMYKLRAAKEDMDSAQLELVSQSFNQNVKALNENNFDVEGIQQRALAAVEKVKASLHGLEYDLTGLESAAKNILSQDDFTKFNNQLKAAQDNIQAIKNSTVSKSSMNPLANMQRDMQNASIEIETMRLKLEKFGDIQGVAEAKQMLTEMAEAAKQFNSAATAQDQQSAYNQYSNLRSQFNAQTEYVKAAKEFNASQQSNAKQLDPIRDQYQSLLDVVNKINTANSNIIKAQNKDGGTGLYSGYINQLQSSKESLIAQLRSITQEINTTLSGGFVQGKEVSTPFAKFLGDDYSAVSDFLNSTQTQASLTTEEIERLVAALQKAQNIDVQAASRVAEQFRTVQETWKSINSTSFFDKSSKEYMGAEGAFANVLQYYNSLPSDSTQWAPEQTAQLQALISAFNEYGNVLATVGQKQAQYFANKSEYISGTEVVQSDAQIKAIESQQQAYDILKAKADEFAKASGASSAMVTNFVQSADGISRLDFSILKQGTLAVEKFSMELGSLNLNKTFLTDMNANAFTSTFQSANKQLESMGELMQRLQMSGANMDQSGIVKMTGLMKQLHAELLNGQSADTNIMSKLTKDAKMSMAEVEKLYSQMTKMQQSIFSKEALELGKVNTNGDVYSQMTAHIADFAMLQPNATVAVGKFNEATRTLGFTLTDTNGQVREFRASVDALTGTMTTQQVGVGHTASLWSQFGTELSSVGKMIKYATVGYYSMSFQIIRWAREGISAVKEIDAALTELKKVTDETDESYKNFLQDASKTGSEIGTKVSDFTEATANFARLGYTMSESADMAKTAIVYKNVADGIDNVEASTDSIISTMKAFGIETNDTMSIADRFNAVGNNFAITSAGIGEALQRSAAALAEGGNTIDESIALITAANTVVQNPETVGKYIAQQYSNML